MTKADVELIAKNPDQQWFRNISEVAKILGRDRHDVSAFLKQNAVPHYRIGKAKMYFLRDVLDAVDRTRWKN